MDPISRRNFIGKAGLAGVLSTLPDGLTSGQGTGPKWQGGEVANETFRLSMMPGDGLKKTRLVHVPTDLLLADADYNYSFGPVIFSESFRTTRADGSTTITLRGHAPGNLEVAHTFQLPSQMKWMEEQITLTNRGKSVLALPYARCGFVLPVALTKDGPPAPWRDFKFTAIPFRRETPAGRDQYAEYSLLQILNEPRHSILRAKTPVSIENKVVVPIIHSTGFIQTLYPEYASEGWCFTDGRRGFLISKYSQDGMEWAVLDRAPVDSGATGLRWGGLSIFQGDPEQGAWLRPGESHGFGVTRITAFGGGMEEGFYAFRSEMEARGHRCPPGFDPPVHWNELFDNKLWWLPANGMNDPENRKKYYTLTDMKEEAAKAKVIGCQALYLDPGWDTDFASKIWDEARLGKLRDFVSMLKNDYGLSLSLHTPMSGWCDPTSYASTINRMSRDGSRINNSLCGASQQYVEETLSRLSALARDGATFFMFDGTFYNGECWDPQHGHRIPAQREDHVQAMNRLARLVHVTFPSVLIEMHDQILGGTTLRYVPIYYGHGTFSAGTIEPTGSGFDTVWAFEMMWDPMTDLVGGHAISLYYYNLAYSLPLYIHIDLRKDNRQALMFWWNASTCRHLGIGGTHADPTVRQAQKEAMATYRRLEPFFKAGRFYGIDEMAHVHVHPTQQAAVFNCFNLDENPARREITFDPAKYRLDPNASYEVRGVPSRAVGNQIVLTFEIPPLGHQLAEIYRK